MFPFGAIGAWSKAQRAEWQHSALHVVDTVATPVSAASFHVFKETTSVLLPSDSVFFLVVEVFHHKRANLEPYKDWKRVSKQRQAANTREDIPTMEVENLQRSHQNRKLHEDFDWRLWYLWWLRQDIPMPRCANVSPVARQVPLPPWTLVAQCRCLSQNASKNYEMAINFTRTNHMKCMATRFKMIQRGCWK